MKEEDTGKKFEYADRLVNDEDKEHEKMVGQDFSGKQLIISEESLEEQTLQKVVTPSEKFLLKKEVIDTNQNIDNPLLDKQIIVEKENIQDSTPKKEAVSSSVARKSTKIVKSVSIEKDNQPLTTKLSSEAKVISTAITEVRGGENNLSDACHCNQMLCHSLQ